MHDANTVRPPFAYFGGKQAIADRVVACFPEHEHYVEPYCGGLSILCAKAPSKLETVNDLDGDIMHFWRMLRDHSEELVRACALTPHARAEHLLSRQRHGHLDDIERARRIWVAISQGRGGQLTKTGWRYFIARSNSSKGMPGYLEAYVDRMAPMVERLHRVSLECMPAIDLIDRYGSRPEVLLYVDPPYLGSSRGHAHSYQHEMRSPEMHADLARALNACKCAVVLSGYHSPLYDELYAGWDITEISASTSQGTGPRERTEVLWSKGAQV